MSKKIKLSEIKQLIIEEIKILLEQGLKMDAIGALSASLRKLFSGGDEALGLSDKLRKRRAARRPGAKAKSRIAKNSELKAKSEELKSAMKILDGDNFKSVMETASRSPGLASFDPKYADELIQLRKFLDDVIDNIGEYKQFKGSERRKKALENQFVNNAKAVRDRLKKAEAITPTRTRFSALADSAKLGDEVKPKSVTPTDPELNKIVDELEDISKGNVPKEMGLEDTVDQIQVNFSDDALRALEKKLIAGGVVLVGAGTIAALALKGNGTNVKNALASKDAAPATPSAAPAGTQPAAPASPASPASPPATPATTTPSTPSSSISIINELKEFLDVKGGPIFIRHSLVRVHNLLSQNMRKQVSKDNPRDPGTRIPISDSEARKMVSAFIEAYKSGLVGMDAKDLVVRGEHSKKAKDIVDFYEEVLSNLNGAEKSLSTVDPKAQKIEKVILNKDKIKAIIESSIKTVVFGNKQKMGGTKTAGGQKSDRLRSALAKSFGLGAGGEKVRLKPLQEEKKSYDLKFNKWSKLWK